MAVCALLRYNCLVTRVLADTTYCHKSGAALLRSRSAQSSASGQLLLYENNKVKPGYFKLISIISAIQLLFWANLSHFAFTELKERKLDKDPHKWKEGSPDKDPQWKDSWFSRFSSLKWRLGLSFLSLGAGVFFAVTACMYPLRIVHRLYLVKRTTSAKVLTYTPLGSTRIVDIPLMDITATVDRQAAKSHVAFKAKGYPLYFLLDKQNGRFLVPKVYDNVIGSRKKVI